MRLRDGVPSAESPLCRLDSVASSVKGGAILYGMSKAAKDGHQYIMYTDCDNSNNLGQVGLLLRSLREGGNKAAIGDRKGTRVSHWQSTRDSESESNSVLRRVRRLLDFDPILRDVTCPFKMFQREYLLKLLDEVDVFDFCFDYDILGNLKKNEIATGIVPIVSLDSESESTWISLTIANVWRQKFRGFVQVAEKYELSHNKEAANLIRGKLWTLESIQNVLEATSHGVMHRGRMLSAGEVSKLLVQDIDEWLQSLSVK
jgi:Glycosyl transferase family 2